MIHYCNYCGLPFYPFKNKIKKTFLQESFWLYYGVFDYENETIKVFNYNKGTFDYKHITPALEESFIKKNIIKDEKIYIDNLKTPVYHEKCYDNKNEPPLKKYLKYQNDTFNTEDFISVIDNLTFLKKQDSKIVKFNNKKMKRSEIFKLYQEYKKKDDDRSMNEYCIKPSGFALELQQQFLKKYITNNLNKIDKMLLYHGIGTGKTCTSIVISEQIMNINNDYRTLVILPARLKTNFIDELISGCTFNKYLSEEEHNLYFSPEISLSKKTKIYNKFLENINQKYDIYSYEKIISIAKKQTSLKKWIKDITKNKVIIIDEIHNLLSGKIDQKGYKKSIEENKLYAKTDNINSLFINIFSNFSHNTSKTFLLTATPIFDNYNQFIDLTRILTTDNSISYKTELVDAIKLLKNKVSFFTVGNKNAYPEVIYKNEDILLTKSQVQSLLTLGVEDDKGNDELPANSFLIKHRQLSISTYNYEKVKKVLENPKEYAPKLLKITNYILNKLKGKHLVYCTFIENGLYILRNILRTYGFIDIFEDIELNDKNNYKRYVIWDAKLKDKNKKYIKELVNSKKNVDGKIIKVILGSPSIKEGISFKHIQDMHIIDPVWNNSAKTQIEGRAVRLCSHVDILEKDEDLKRKVIIHIYKSIPNPKYPDIFETADQKIYDVIIPEKQKNIIKCENALKKVSIDYYLFNKEAKIKKIDDNSNSSDISVSDKKIVKQKNNINKNIKNNCPKIRRPDSNGICKEPGYTPRKNSKGFICCYKKELPKNILNKTCLPKSRRPDENNKCQDGYESKLNKHNEYCCYKKELSKNILNKTCLPKSRRPDENNKCQDGYESKLNKHNEYCCYVIKKKP